MREKFTIESKFIRIENNAFYVNKTRVTYAKSCNLRKINTGVVSIVSYLYF